VFGFDRGTNRTNHRAPRRPSIPNLAPRLPPRPVRPTPAAAAGGNGTNHDDIAIAIASCFPNPAVSKPPSQNKIK